MEGETVSFTYDPLEEGTSKIVAFEPPCKCSAKRWFQCTCDRERWEYVGPGIDQTGRPRADFLAFVRSEHPTADLVHL